MKTNRRGFFGALTGFVGGVYAAFTSKAKAKVPLGKVDDWTIGGGNYEYTVIRMLDRPSDTASGSFEYMIYGIDKEGEKTMLCPPTVVPVNDYDS